MTWICLLSPSNCLVDDYCRQLFPNGVCQRGFEPELTDQEALTIEIVGEFLGLERDKAIFEYFYRHYRLWFPALRDRTLLVRQWANLWLVKFIWQAIVRDSGACYDTIQVIDTPPLPFYRLQSAARRSILVGDILMEPDVGLLYEEANVLTHSSPSEHETHLLYRQSRCTRASVG